MFVTATRVKMDAHAAAARFAEVDTDNDFRIDFDQFCCMQPTKVCNAHSHTEIRSWFMEMDGSSNGSLSVTEYFKWTIAKISLRLGTQSVLSFFSMFDTDSTGYLDSFEFQRVTDALGFGAAGHHLFLAFDSDYSGYIDYSELLNAFSSKAKPAESAPSTPVGPAGQPTTANLSDVQNRPAPKPMVRSKSSLIGLAFQSGMATAWNQYEIDVKYMSTADTLLAIGVDTSGEALNQIDKSHAVEQLFKQIGVLLRATGISVVELLPMFNPNDHGNVNEANFELVVSALGYKGASKHVHDLYAKLANDGGGKVGLDQIYLLVHGRNSGMRRIPTLCRTLALDPGEYKVKEWTPDELRHQLQSMLLRARVSPVELIEDWDADSNGYLSRREFLVHMRRVFQFGNGEGQRIWDLEARNITTEIFESLAGGKRSIPLLQFERWIDQDWPEDLDEEDAPQPGALDDPFALRAETQMRIGSSLPSLQKQGPKIPLGFLDTHSKKLARPKQRPAGGGAVPHAAPLRVGAGACSSYLRRPAHRRSSGVDWGGPSWGWDSSTTDARGAWSALSKTVTSRSAQPAAAPADTVPSLRPACYQRSSSSPAVVVKGSRMPGVAAKDPHVAIVSAAQTAAQTTVQAVERAVAHLRTGAAVRFQAEPEVSEVLSDAALPV